jgi:protease I
MAESRDLEGRRVLAVIAPRDFRDEELFEPRAALEARGAAVAIASTAKGAATGMLGGHAEAGLAIADCAASDFDAVFVVGGMGSPRHLWDDRALHALLRDFYAQGKPVAAICLSGAVLANAGLLEGKRATVFCTDRSLAALRAGGATYVSEPIVQDGQILTAGGPHAAKLFARALGDRIAKVRAAAG